jgi:hypothetical protein
MPPEDSPSQDRTQERDGTRADAVGEVEFQAAVIRWARDYPGPTVSSQLYAQLMRQLVRASDAIFKALEPDQPPHQMEQALGALPPPALGGLGLLAVGQEPADVLLRFDLPESDLPILTELTALARDNAELVLRVIRDRNAEQFDQVLSRADIQEIDAALRRKPPEEVAKEFAAMMQSHAEVLGALQASYLAGNDISQQLDALSRSGRFREVVLKLAEQVRLDEPVTRSTDPVISDAIARYEPLLRLSRQIALERGGRINHWVNIKLDRYLDLDTGIPQVEARLYSYTDQLFHFKDDVDDVLRLCGRLLDFCASTLEIMQQRSINLRPQSVDEVGDAVKDLARHSERLTGYMSTYRQDRIDE